VVIATQRIRSPGVVRGLAASALAVALLWWGIPKITGATWSAISDTMRVVTWPEIAVLAGLWIAGLVAHSFVLTGALPGLTWRRALTLNLTGSAVSNVAPLGGALGVATNLVMVRAWSFKDSAFAVFTLVTNVWDVLAKLVLPIVAVTVLFLVGGVAGHALNVAAVVAVVFLLLVVIVGVVGLASDTVSRVLARGLARMAHRVLPARLASRAEGLEDAVVSARDHTRSIVRQRWPQLTAGMASYVVLQAVLMWLSLHVVGADLGFSAVLAGFAVERFLTLAMLTPGGAGIAEAATVATLVALGGDPLTVAAGVLIYRGFTFLLEIPVGGLWLGGWLISRARRGTVNA
jgi:uncharacterized membrane protein YbhN (UPF0104 family)